MPEYESNCSACESKGLKNLKDHWRRQHPKEYEEWKERKGKESELYTSRRKISDSDSSSNKENPFNIPNYAWGTTDEQLRKNISSAYKWDVKRQRAGSLSAEEREILGVEDPTAPVQRAVMSRRQFRKKKEKLEQQTPTIKTRDDKQDESIEELERKLELLKTTKEE